jgi:sugar diacid utilization regulator
MTPDEPARLHELHARMVDAVLSGDGMREVAQIAAARAGAPVAIVIPSLGHELVEPGDGAAAVLAVLRPWVDKRLAGEDVEAPGIVVREVPVNSGAEALGAIALLEGGEGLPDAETRGILHLAAMAAVTELALVESRQQLEDEMRGSFLEELRAGSELDGAEVQRRAARMGCDLARGAVILAADPAPERAHRLMAAIKADCPDAFVQRLEGRVYAVISAADREDARDHVTALAATLARKLRAHAAVGISSFYANPGELGRAIKEADLIVDVVGRADVPPESVADGTYRLLLQLLAQDRGHLDDYHEQTIAPIARYDDQYRTELVGTLATYLDHDCNMNATAAALYAHRHTIAYRLERIKELTGLDTARHEHRERLSLGVKIHRLTGQATSSPGA